VQYDVDYERADNPGGTYNYAAGDYWTDNSVHQPAMHQFVDIDDVYGGSQTVQLDDTGCAKVSIDVPGQDYPNAKFDATLTNLAEVDGVDVELRVHPTSGTDTSWSGGLSPSVEVQNILEVDGGSTTLTVDAINGWQFMPIATYMLDRQDWRLDESVSRDCCLDNGPGSYNLDGTCGTTNPDPYTRNALPYLASAPLIALYAKDGGSCCGSKHEWTNGGLAETALSGPETAQWRMTISHELGHMFAGIRMGDWERGMYNWDPPMDGCIADGFVNGGVWQTLPTSARGIASKEAMARAMREGWAEYIKVWTWNSASNASPEVTSFNLLDLDLDMDADNEWDNPGDDHPYDKAFTVGTGMELGQAVSGDPTAGWVTSLDENWLKTAIDQGQCSDVSIPACTPREDRDIEFQNRATVYDVADFWWSLENKGFTPDELLDLYIDTCPREWRHDEPDPLMSCPPIDDDLPYQRMLLSADHHGVLPLVQFYFDNHVGY
jgi:hypothetical protein